MGGNLICGFLERAVGQVLFGSDWSTVFELIICKPPQKCLPYWILFLKLIKLSVNICWPVNQTLFLGYILLHLSIMRSTWCPGLGEANTGIPTSYSIDTSLVKFEGASRTSWNMCYWLLDYTFELLLHDLCLRT